uniref:Cytochrome c biogenesis FN n=1 Tax=Cephalotaxus sinensis TaxID=89484 RepID=A0A8F4RHE2_9CONI|nr:cytochrome c biogenesis FN [Cephalotaxus sinensis]
MSVNELCHYPLLPGLSVAFAYDRKQPPAFGASPHFLCTLLSLLGPSFRHTPSNSPNYNVFTNSNANAPLLYQIPGTWSNHEGSIPPRCRIPSFYGFPFRYRVQPHNVSERGRETAFCSFVSSSVKPEQRLLHSASSGAEEDFEQARTSAPYIDNCHPRYIYGASTPPPTRYSRVGGGSRAAPSIYIWHSTDSRAPIRRNIYRPTEHYLGWHRGSPSYRYRGPTPTLYSHSHSRHPHIEERASDRYGDRERAAIRYREDRAADTDSWRSTPSPPLPSIYKAPPLYLRGIWAHISRGAPLYLRGIWAHISRGAPLYRISRGGPSPRILKGGPLYIESQGGEIGRNRTLNRNKNNALLDPERQGPFRRNALLDRGGSGGSRAPSRYSSARSGPSTSILKKKKATRPIYRTLHLARDAEERAEQRISGAVGIALFSPLFPSASSNPFVRNSFVRTESPAESNPVLQDPVLAIHPPCIYAGDVASAMGFGPCIYKMMNGIVALYSPMQKEGNGALCSAGCVGAPVNERGGRRSPFPSFNVNVNGAHPTQYQSTGGIIGLGPPLYNYRAFGWGGGVVPYISNSARPLYRVSREREGPPPPLSIETIYGGRLSAIAIAPPSIYKGPINLEGASALYISNWRGRVGTRLTLGRLDPNPLYGEMAPSYSLIYSGGAPSPPLPSPSYIYRAEGPLYIYGPEFIERG